MILNSTPKRLSLFVVILLMISFQAQAQRAFMISVKGHPDAMVKLADEPVSGEIKLADLDKDTNEFTATKAGYRQLAYKPMSRKEIKDYLKINNTTTLVLEPFDTRMVEITTAPYDGVIYINGERKGTQNVTLEVPRGKTFTLELKKNGYQTQKRTYAYLSEENLPLAKDHIILENRVINVSSNLNDARILVNGQAIGKGQALAVVPKDECIEVIAEKEGFVPVKQKFCNIQGDVNQAPLNYDLVLEDRLIKLRTTPPSASIKVDGKIMNQGQFDIKVPKGACVEVIVENNGYEYTEKSYCNDDRYVNLPTTEHIVLNEDEAFLSSAQVDQANIDIAVDIAEGRTKKEAWQIISMIVTSHFDVLEITDENTGYIRTSWVLNPFPQNTIRTRLIVKQSSISPLQFKVKLQSQYSGEAQTSVKNDHEFKDWDRILNTYTDMFSELQARLTN